MGHKTGVITITEAFILKKVNIRVFRMGNAWSSLKEKRKEKKELKRYFRRFYFSILDSLLMFPEKTLSPNNSTLTK